MKTATWLRRASGLGMLGIAMLAANTVWADENAAAEEKPPTAQAEPAPKEKEKEKHAITGNYKPLKYRLHLSLERIPPALDEQLGLKGEGVLVDEVEPDGPAAKAGIKPHDIILTISDKVIKNTLDLVSAVNELEGKELTIKLLHGGKPVTLSVTPAPAGEGSGADKNRRKLDIEARELERMIREKVRIAGADVRVGFISPGKVFASGKWPGGPEFPDDLTVNIHKQGKNPAEIEVKKGEQTWTIKGDQLDQLPAEIRGHVAAMLGDGRPWFMSHPPIPGEKPALPVPPYAPGEGPLAPPATTAEPSSPYRAPSPHIPPQAHELRSRMADANRARERARATVEKRLDEMTRRMDEMRNQLRGLRENLREQDDREEQDDDGVN